MGSIINGDDEAPIHDPLLPESSTIDGAENRDATQLASRFWVESKKLWHIVGPAIFSRLVNYSMNVISQAFGGHLGDAELAAISIGINVIVGFSFGFLVNSRTLFLLELSPLYLNKCSEIWKCS